MNFCKKKFNALEETCAPSQLKCTCTDPEINQGGT